MEFKFNVGQSIATRTNQVGTVEERKEDEYGISYLIKVGDEIKWINEDHLHESQGITEEYLTEG